MSTPGPATPVKPVVSMLLAREDLGAGSGGKTRQVFGPAGSGGTMVAV